MARYSKKPKARVDGDEVARRLKRLDEIVYCIDEVVLEGDAGFARVKKGMPNSGMLLIETGPGLFKRPTVRAKDGTPLRIFKECGYSPDGAVYILQGGEWITVNRLPKRCVGQPKRSSKVASHISD